MDTLRYALGVMLAVGVPPAVVFWFAIHPLTRFWRRIGATVSYLALAAGFLVMCVVLYRYRVALLGRDLGTNWVLLVPGLGLYAVSGWISFLTRKHLDLKTFVGVPEISGSPAGGSLIQEGVYGAIRHPRYASVIIGTAGFAMVVNYVGAYLMVLGSIAALLLVAALEERELVDRFGDAYEDYRARVPAFIPRASRKPPSE
jgi:protein-S-isoprenylcysteine O-methyltransferase Ste14